MNPIFAIATAIAFSTTLATAAPEWVYLQNAQLKLGVRKDAGACVGFLAGPDGRNVFNSYDHGRFVQQSYYGQADGSLWVKQPWRYNPVQGGDYKGTPATVLEFKAEPTRLYSKTRPRHWASGADLSEVIMEQWLNLDDDLFHLRARMTYSGTASHPPHHQEIPAVFLQPEFDTLVLHDGKELRRWKPGWPNEHVKFPQHWAMYLDADGKGVGMYVPAADEATCYRFGKAGDASACSYIAPLTTFALAPGKVFEYEAWFTLGSEEQIRARFESLRKRLETAPPR
jgi:hypothetical protein